MISRRATNQELEGVRGVACLLVALGHVFHLTHLDPSVILPAWLKTVEAAHSAVLIFFMLSGYLIGWTNSGPSTPENHHAYLWRRFIRLAPIYYVALALTVALIFIRGDAGQIRSIAAAVAGAQNFNDYFGLRLPPPITNGPLWSLNYELLYYGLFILLWNFQPRLFWVFVPAFVAAGLTWFTPHISPLFLGSYACGWLFWAAGWWLASLPELPASVTRAPVLTWLLLIFAGDHIEGIIRILNVLNLHSADAGMVTLGDLASFPAILLLLAAAARRQLPAMRLLTLFSWSICVVPLAGMFWTDELWTHPSWVTGGVAVLLAATSIGFQNMAWLKSFAWFGRISYAFYVVHFPLLFLVQIAGLPGGTIPAYFLRIAVWAALSLGLAWILEQRFQPWIRTRLLPA